jgi:hypothetical protein
MSSLKLEDQNPVLLFLDARILSCLPSSSNSKARIWDKALVGHFKFFSEKIDELFFTLFLLKTQVKNLECFHHFFVLR